MSQAAHFSQSRAAAGEDSAFLRPEDAITEPECESKRPQSTPPAKLDHHAAQTTSAAGMGADRAARGRSPLGDLGSPSLCQGSSSGTCLEVAQ